jgi:chloramphenicol 3-O-phosphotransferase
MDEERNETIATLDGLIVDALERADACRLWLVGAHLSAAHAALRGEVGPWSDEAVQRAIDKGFGVDPQRRPLR